MNIGAQFYTIRDFCKDTDSFAESLKKVADIGYKYVQISGTCNYDAKWLKENLDKNGLKCVLTHIPAADLTDNTEKVIENHKIFDCKYIGLGYHNFDTDNKEENYNNFVNTYKPAVKAIKAEGKCFMYHNHHFELMKIGNEVILEKLSRDFAPEEMGITLDTYWIQKAGGDPALWLEKLSGRVPCIHLKDMTYDSKMAVVGEGNINFERVFEKAEKSGTKYMLVEQDDCNGENPFDCLKRSYDYLKSRGFE